MSTGVQHFHEYRHAVNKFQRSNETKNIKTSECTHHRSQSTKSQLFHQLEHFFFWNYFFFLPGLFLPLALLRPLGDVGLSCAACSAASCAASSSSRCRSASRNFCRKASRGPLMESRPASTAAFTTTIHWSPWKQVVQHQRHKTPLCERVA